MLQNMGDIHPIGQVFFGSDIHLIFTVNDASEKFLGDMQNVTYYVCF